MELLRAWCWAVLLLALAAGCKTGQVASPSPSATGLVSAPPMTAGPLGAVQQPDTAAPVARPTPIAAVHYQEPLPQPSSDTTGVGERGIGDVLSREWLAAEIEARNPSLAAMIAAWQPAPQTIACLEKLAELRCWKAGYPCRHPIPLN